MASLRLASTFVLLSLSCEYGQHSVYERKLSASMLQLSMSMRPVTRIPRGHASTVFADLAPETVCGPQQGWCQICMLVFTLSGELQTFKTTKHSVVTRTRDCTDSVAGSDGVEL